MQNSERTLRTPLNNQQESHSTPRLARTPTLPHISTTAWLASLFLHLVLLALFLGGLPSGRVSPWAKKTQSAHVEIHFSSNAGTKDSTLDNHRSSKNSPKSEYPTRLRTTLPERKTGMKGPQIPSLEPPSSASLSPNPSGRSEGSSPLVGDDPLQEFHLREFKDQLVQKIRENLNYPRSLIARRVSGTTTVKIELSQNGSLESAQVTQSSGNADLDQLTLQAIVDAQPFPPLPSHHSTLTVHLPIEFKLPPSQN